MIGSCSSPLSSGSLTPSSNLWGAEKREKSPHLAMTSDEGFSLQNLEKRDLL